ncbi:MAG: RNA-binding S4 domain-containing protein [Clostridiales bacterium]|nr:RNA-binding S4 domain-containing protein [Clostridia bacterium]MCR5567128.1 RNA-binding S4 domain-containing protein [Clostridiales bacterium]
MRIDKYLKVSRIIKRRTVASDACSGGRVMINDKVAKPASPVNPGDVISIRFGEHTGHYEVLAVAETVSKDHAAEMYKVLNEDAFLSAERSKT